MNTSPSPLMFAKRPAAATVNSKPVTAVQPVLKAANIESTRRALRKQLTDADLAAIAASSHKGKSRAWVVEFITKPVPAEANSGALKLHDTANSVAANYLEGKARRPDPRPHEQPHLTTRLGNIANYELALVPQQRPVSKDNNGFGKDVTMTPAQAAQSEAALAAKKGPIVAKTSPAKAKPEPKKKGKK